MPFQSEKQRRYLWANEPEIARDWTNRYGARGGGIMDMASDGNLIHDFENYKKGNSVNVPTSFQARSHSTPVNLAYITDDEAGILQSLKPDTPHEGPIGIPNYDDFDAAGNYRTGAAMSAAESGAKNERARADYRASGMSPQEVQDIRSGAIASGAGQTVNPGWFGPRHRPGISKQNLRAAKQFAPKAYRATRGSPFGIGNLFRGAMSMFGGIPGKIGSMLSHINPGKLRGWNEQYGRYNTQDEYEQARTNRRNQKNIERILNRKAPITEMTYKNLARYGMNPEDMPGVGSTPTSRAIDKDYARGMNTYEGPFSRSHLQSLANKQALTNKLSAQNYNFHPSQGGIMSTPQGTDPYVGIEDHYAFKPGSMLDKKLKSAWNTYNETGFGLDNVKTLMEMDIKSNEEKGIPLSLDKSAYSLIG